MLGILEEWKIIEKLDAKNSLVIGDFNIDYLKIGDQSYAKSPLYNVLEEVFIEKTFVQIVKQHTWERRHLDSFKTSLLDHIYCNNIQKIESVINEKQVCGDHNLIAIRLKIELTKYPKMKNQTILDWSNYSPENF